MSRLDTCSLDVQSEIFEYLRFSELLPLRLCGNSSITRAIFSVRRIALLSDDVLPVKLPNMTQFGRLFTLIGGYSHKFGPLLASMQFEVRNLPKTLVLLNLHFKNAFELFLDTNSPVPQDEYLKLNFLLPNLEYLRLKGEWTVPHVNFFLNLPRGLRHLILKVRQPHNSIMHQGSIVFPPDLQTLKLEGLIWTLTPNFCWPRCLLALSLSLRETNPFPELFNTISKDLKRLKLICEGQSDMNWVFFELPPCLISLYSNTGLVTAKALAALPRTLKKLVLPNLLPGSSLRGQEMFEALPPTLEVLDCALTVSGQAHLLPRTLTFGLGLKAHGLEEPDSPPRMARLSDADLSNVPPGLEILYVHYLTSSTIDKLPKQLKTLKAAQPDFTADLSSLPSTLTKIETTFSPLFENEAQIKALPKTLTDLNTLLTTNNFKFSDGWLLLLPKTLVTLNITLGYDVLTDQSIPDMSDFTSLRTLHLTSPDDFQSGLTSEILHKLPRKLTKLKLVLKGIIHEDHLGHLSPYLYSLFITSNQFCGIANPTVKLLSRRLTYLHLPSCPYLTMWCYDDLPPALETLEFYEEVPTWFKPKLITSSWR